MINMYLAQIRRILFKSPKADGVDREAWMRRALLWKMTAMCLMAENKDPSIKKHYKLCMQADQVRSPTETELSKAAPWLQNYVQKNQEKTKIIIAKK